ncbi:MAG TPA: hypothetical protein VH592_17670 [Gemmataceae bacterium]
MSPAPSTQINGPDLEQERRRIATRLEEIARLSESNVPAGVFFSEMLKRLLETLAAPAGVVWARTPQGNLQMQYQINLKEIGLDQNEEVRASHEELLRQAVTQPRPFHMPPRSGVQREDGKAQAGNLTNYLLLIAPIIVNQQCAGLIEIWQNANRPPQAITGYLQFMTYMAELSSRYQRNQVMGQLTGQQQVWTQLENFARLVHASLHPTEVAYQVANEGRRLVECDRMSVAIRQYGSKGHIEAVSGADVVERRSNLIRLMRKLSEEVIKWGEKLIFSGTRDDSLPPRVLTALDHYLAESNSKLLVVQPLRDDRETGKRPPRSALVMECFEPPAEPQQLIARLDVVARHATPALYNAVEHRRIPGRWVWQPLAKLQDGIGGKAKAITAVVVGLLSFLVAMLFLVPYELEMDSTGKLVPWARRVVYAPSPGQVMEFKVEPAMDVPEKSELAVLFSTDLFQKYFELQAQIEGARLERGAADLIRNRGPGNKDQGREAAGDEGLKRDIEKRKARELEEFIDRNNANPDKPGEYFLRAPDFTAEEKMRVGKLEWTVLTGNFNDEWRGRMAKPSDPILKLGAKDGPWEIELRIPQKHISQVLKAFEYNGGEALDVNFILRSEPSRKYRGILKRDKIASEAIPNRDEKDESEPEVIAYVTIDDASIDLNYRLPLGALTSGTEVRAKVRCGKHSMGYSLFYGVWEFLYEKVVFFF